MREITILIFLLSAFAAEARMDEGSGGGRSSTWNLLKSRAEQKMNEFMWFVSKKLDQLTAEKDTKDARKPASVEKPLPVVEAPPVPKAVEERKVLADIIEETRKAVTAEETIQTASPGRPSAPDLPKTKSGVAKFDLMKTETRKDKKTGKMKTVKIRVKDIPRLDIGEERKISRLELLPNDALVAIKTYEPIKALPEPKSIPQKEIDKLTKAKLPVIAKAKRPKVAGLELGSIVTQKKIDDVSLNMLPEKPMTELKPYTPFSEDEMTMLTAVMFFERGDKCHLVSGLLDKLARKPAFSEEANFYLGVCAHKMGFHSEAVTRLLRVLDGDQKEYVRDAITNLVENLPREFDKQVSRSIKNLKNTNYIAPEAKDSLNYVMARAAHARGNYGESTNYSSLVSEASPRYPSARYIHGIGLYSLKKEKQAEQVLLELRDWMGKNGKVDKNIEALIAVNVGRIRFMQNRYQAAFQEYHKVPKDHPLWVQALIEQGWTQLHIDDAPGAIGNMYSLHSPYFRSVFMPESWVVRTLGYIDICQYGDAYRTLTRLEKSHAGYLNKMHAYLAKNNKPSSYYQTVRNYIKGKSDNEVDGLPPQVIREIARQRGFLNVQTALNNREDEISQYGFIQGFINKDIGNIKWKMRKARERIAELNANLKKVKTQPELAKHVNEWRAHKRNEEALLNAYGHELRVYEESRRGYLSMKSSALARIEKEKSGLRTDAGKQLRDHLKSLRAKVEQIIEGNEFLRYEIFAGSGENIRYQVAGGATANTRRIPAGVKPQKILNWEFDGEYWEDEIGSYRSTLKNNCPKNSRGMLTSGADKSAADVE